VGELILRGVGEGEMLLVLLPPQAVRRILTNKSAPQVIFAIPWRISFSPAGRRPFRSGSFSIAVLHLLAGLSTHSGPFVCSGDRTQMKQKRLQQRSVGMAC
jgi:hypothetical protein